MTAALKTNTKVLATSTRISLSGLADTLGNLNAEIAILEAEAKRIKAALIESGEPIIEGALFRVSVSTAERASIDTAAVRAVFESAGLDVPTKSSTVTTVRVSGR
jgi:hypothetical protein